MSDIKHTLDMAKGFNNAMILKKHSPDIAKTMHDALKDANDEYAWGFRDGMEYSLDKGPSKSKEQEKTNESSSIKSHDEREVFIAKKGFNHGYNLKKQYPQLATKVNNAISKIQTKDIYQEAFLSGVGQHEKIKPRTRSFTINRVTPKRKTKEKDKGMDRTN